MLVPIMLLALLFAIIAIVFLGSKLFDEYRYRRSYRYPQYGNAPYEDYRHGYSLGSGMDEYPRSPLYREETRSSFFLTLALVAFLSVLIAFSSKNEDKMSNHYEGELQEWVYTE